MVATIALLVEIAIPTPMAVRVRLHLQVDSVNRGPQEAGLDSLWSQGERAWNQGLGQVTIMNCRGQVKFKLYFHGNSVIRILFHLNT